MNEARATLRIAIWLLTLAAAFAALMVPARAVEIEFNGGPVRRDILAIYDSRQEKTPQTSRIHQFAEMPLNWLGQSLTYVDVNGPLPPVEQLGNYRGIVTWLIEPMEGTQRYLTWLDGATAAGLKLVIFSDLAPGYPARAEKIATRIHARLGLMATSDHVSVTHKVKVSVATPQMVGFERPLDKALADFRVMHVMDGHTSVHLSASVPDDPGGPPSALIATGPGGGYVSDEYAIAFDANTDRVRWIMNPFLFLKLALIGKERMPIPDVTTLSGRRIYFSQIDGDGWNNVSLIDGYRQGQVISADVIRKEAIEAYPDLPVSVGAIAGDLIPELGGSLAGRQAARRLYALPQVEIGSHTYTHPFDWKFYENYSRAKEVELIEKARSTNQPFYERARRAAFAALGQAIAIDPTAGYVAGSSDLPRTYLKDPFDLNREVSGALAFIESLAPSGKKTQLYQWSGNCLPFEAAIAATRAAGVRNMNGGDSRLDAEFPSVFYVPPISKPVGAQRQIYSGNSNENTYTNDWTGPYYGFAMLGETVRNTEAPRRLKPFNIYYHMYSGERESALAALRQNLNLARSMSLTPVPASQYAAIADDFFATKLSRIDSDAWSIQGRGNLQTLRFDDAEALMVDMDKSKGVLGSTRHVSGALYVALDPAVEPASVALKERAVTAATSPPRPGAELVSSRWWFSRYQLEGCGFSITAQGFGYGEMVWQTAAGRRFDVTAEREGQELTHTTAIADATGLMQLSVATDAITPVKLSFACHE